MSLTCRYDLVQSSEPEKAKKKSTKTEQNGFLRMKVELAVLLKARSSFFLNITKMLG
jgi:hypothetical protein